MQRNTFFGRYLSFTFLFTESDFLIHSIKCIAKNAYKLDSDHELKKLENKIARVFNRLGKYEREKTKNWLTQAVDLNWEKKEEIAFNPVASNGFMINLLSLTLNLSKALWIESASDKHLVSVKSLRSVKKVNCFYLK